MTSTARTHYRKVISETRDRWGIDQAEKYRAALTAGFRYIARNHKSFASLHREGLAEGTAFSLHLVEHHYVVFQRYRNSIVIAGIFYKKMNIPAHLKELQTMSRQEIVSIKRLIHKQN